MKKVLSIISIIAGGLVLLSVVVPVIIGAVLKAQTADSSIGIIGRAVALLGYLRYSTLKELITSIAVTGILLKVLFNTNAPMTRIVVIPFLVFAVALGMKNALIMMNKKVLAIKVSKVYVVAFLIYWFGFFIYWDYASFMDGNYMKMLYSVPFWLGGIYFTYKRLFKK